MATERMTTRMNCTRRLARWAAVGALVAGTGCSQVTRPQQTEQAEKVNLDVLLHEQLQKEAIITVAEAYRALLLLADGEERFTSFEQREAELARRGIIRGEWNLQRDQAMDRGSVAYMVMQILRIRGGVNSQLFGRVGLGDRRYALRELSYMELMQPGPDYRYITGSELVDVMARADDYMAERGMYQHAPVDIEQEVERQKKVTTSAPR